MTKLWLSFPITSSSAAIACSCKEGRKISASSKIEAQGRGSRSDVAEKNLSAWEIHSWEGWLLFIRLKKKKENKKEEGGGKTTCQHITTTSHNPLPLPCRLPSSLPSTLPLLSLLSRLFP